MRAKKSRHHVVVALFAAALVGCIAFVKDHAYGDHCAFAGRDTACGLCLARSCQTYIDACCGDDLCDGLLSVVEGCAASQDAQCDSVRNTVIGVAGAKQTLAACVYDLCGGACANAPATSMTACKEGTYSDGIACDCQLASDQMPATRYQCSPSDVPNTKCCAPQTWPAAGTQCTCSVANCSPLDDGCSCNLSDSYDPTAVDTCDGTICCVTASNCRCGSTPCEGDEQIVASCTLATTPCGVGSTPVAQCSIPSLH